jgi:hypothetical protein
VKKILTTAVSALAFLCVSSGIALAQEEETAAPNLVPVETFTCNYNDGKGPADLDTVIAEWNDLMDEKGVDYYFAATITPHYFGEWPFDIGWLGAWTDGNKMGAGTDMWLGEGGKVAAMFNEVLSCDSHSNFVSMNVKRGPEDEDESDNSFVMSFSNCSMKDGKSFDDYLTAQEAWTAYQDEHGFTNSTWVMFPIFGETDDSYDFKAIDTNDDHTAFGSDYQLMSEGHWRKSSELFEDLLDCDIARLYNATAIRSITAGDDD